MKNIDEISVCLPAYNGEKFIFEQILSIINQKDVKVHLYIRDDCSNDNTYQIIKNLKSVQSYRGNNLGVMQNINWLLHNCMGKTKYFALSDQDDIWYPDKLAIQMLIMHKLEQKHGSDVPLLVCSDARCCSDELRLIAPSFLKFLGIPHNLGCDLRQILVMSHALGCSCIGNTALQNLALPIPNMHDIYMHDWWLLLIASFFGAVYCIRKPLLDYRQHGNNYYGARSQLPLRKRFANSLAHAKRTQRQAHTFLARYKSRLSSVQCRYLTGWAEMPISPRWLRLWNCFIKGFGKPGLSFFIT